VQVGADGGDTRPLVLDIGTGSGLLSMLSARMGVKEVYTCERDAAMAEAAKQCIGANHLSEKIHVINKSSKEMDSATEEFPERASVLVAEIFGDDPLNEGVIATIEHARHSNPLPPPPVKLTL